MRFVSVLASAFSLLGPKAKKGTEPTPAPSQDRPKPEAPPTPAAPQAEDAQQVAEQLLGRIQPLWLKRQGLDMEVRFQTGRVLLERLYASGQDRLPYGTKVMDLVSLRIGVCRPDLHRMVKLTREFKDLAAFRAQYPGVTSWDKVKKLLAQTPPAKVGASKRKPQDPAQAIRKRIGKHLDAITAELASVPDGAKGQLAAECQAQFRAVEEELRKLLSGGSAVTPDSRDDVTSREGGDK